MSDLKLGAVVRMPDGRIGTVVFNGFKGVGLKEGVHHPNPKDFEGTFGDFSEPSRDATDWPWIPDFYITAHWPCRGVDYELVGASDQEVTP